MFFMMLFVCISFYMILYVFIYFISIVYVFLWDKWQVVMQPSFKKIFLDFPRVRDDLQMMQPFLCGFPALVRVYNPLLGGCKTFRALPNKIFKSTRCCVSTFCQTDFIPFLTCILDTYMMLTSGHCYIYVLLLPKMDWYKDSYSIQ